MEGISALLISYLRELITKQEVIEKYRTCPKHFTRKRKLPFWRVSVLILQGWTNSIQNRVNKFFKSLGSLEELPTATAFCKAREKIKPELLKAIGLLRNNQFAPSNLLFYRYQILFRNMSNE